MVAKNWAVDSSWYLLDHFAKPGKRNFSPFPTWKAAWQGQNAQITWAVPWNGLSEGNMPRKTRHCLMHNWMCQIQQLPPGVRWGVGFPVQTSVVEPEDYPAAGSSWSRFHRKLWRGAETAMPHTHGVWSPCRRPHQASHLESRT